MRGMRVGPAGRFLSFGVGLALILAMADVAPVGATTVTNIWQAKIGSAGVNGTATVQAYLGGAASITLKLAKLKPSTSLPVTLSKGTCRSLGSTLVSFPAIKTTSNGAASRTTSLTAAQLALVIKATAGTGRIAIRVGSSATGGVKCGLFSALAIPPYLAATITVGLYALGVTLAPNGVLVTCICGTLSRVDPATNSVLALIPVTTTGHKYPAGIAYGENAVWVAMWAFDATGQNPAPGSVARLDPVTDAGTATIPVGITPVEIATSPGAVWVANAGDGTVSRIDPTTNQVVATITLAAGVAGLTFDFGSLWVANELTGSVTRIDPATNTTVATISTVGSAEAVASVVGAIWVANYGTEGQPDGVVSRIDPASNQVTMTIPVGTNPFFLTSGGGSLWISPAREATVVEVNPITSAVTQIPTGSTALDSKGKAVGLAGIVASDHAVWAVQAVPMPDPAPASPPQSTLFRVNF